MRGSVVSIIVKKFNSSRSSTWRYIEINAEWSGQQRASILQFIDPMAQSIRFFLLASLLFASQAMFIDESQAALPSCARIFSLFTNKVESGFKSEAKLDSKSEQSAEISSQARLGFRRTLQMHFSQGKEGYTVIDQLAESVKASDPETRQVYIEETLDLYRQLSKTSTANGDLPTVSQRRLADRMLFLVARGDLMISNLIKSGLSPKKAYEEYFALMNSKSKTPYSPKEVFLVLETLQEILRQGPYPSAGENAFLMVGGSLFNGRADLSRSDVDVSVPTKEWKQHFSGDQNQRALNRIFKDAGLASDLGYEVHSFINEHFFGLIQPVAFRISRTSIELVLYAPPSRNPKIIYHVEPHNFKPTEIHLFE